MFKPALQKTGEEGPASALGHKRSESGQWSGISELVPKSLLGLGCR